MNSRGASLIYVLGSLAFASVVALVITNYVETQSKALRQIQIGLARNELSALSLQSLAQADVCSCQLDRLRNPSTPSLGVNTTVNPIPPTPINKIYRTCTFGTDDVIAETLQPLPQSVGPVVESIRLINVLPMTGAGANRFTGQIEYRFRREPGSVHLSPVYNEVAFELDLSTPPNSRRVAGCLKPKTAAAPLVCPPGYGIIGAPTDPAATCMETTLRPAIGYSAAQNLCGGLSYPGFGFPAYLCGTGDLRRACVAGLYVSSTAWEMTSGFVGAGPGISYVALGAGCASSGVVIGNYPFRCCVR